MRDTFAREVYEPATSSFKRTTFTGPVYVHVVQLAFSLAPRPPFSPGEKRIATCGNRNRASAIEACSLTRFRGNLHFNSAAAVPIVMERGPYLRVHANFHFVVNLLMRR